MNKRHPSIMKKCLHYFRRDSCKFCSKECHVAYQRKDYKYASCQCCGKPITLNWYKKRTKIYFCSPECYKKYRAQSEVTCAGCGTKFMAHPSRQVYYNKLYCSKDCYLQNGCLGTVGFIHNKRYDTIRLKLSKTSEYLRWKHAILERDNYTCVQCGSSEDLRVHHIVQFYKIVYKYNPTLSMDKLQDVISSPEFNDPANGKTLCNTCHIQEHHL